MLIKSSDSNPFLNADESAPISITFPFLEASLCCKNSGRCTIPINHNPCESFFSAVASPACFAIARTSGLSNSPMGNNALDNCA